MLADGSELAPNVLATPVLIASHRAAEAAARAEQDARSVLQSLGGSGTGRCIRGVLAEIRCRLRTRPTSVAPTPGDDGIPQLLGWVTRLEAAMDRRAFLDSLASIPRHHAGPTDMTWLHEQMLDVLEAGVAAWLQCGDDFLALHRDTLEPGFRIACGSPERDA